MIKRTIEVSTRGMQLRLQDNSLVLHHQGADVAEIPCEDIGVLMLDSPQINCSQAVLTAIVDRGGVVVFCGKDHHPAGLLLPLAGNQLHTKRLRAQLGSAKPLQKQVWKSIIRAKLKNQAALLAAGCPERKRIETLASEVRSGDPANCEAQGAKLYFSSLFGKEFRRLREGTPPNNLLNYGYMALRATMARAIVQAGLHPALGVHHKHRNNPYCLADDLMEPYRPFVDKRALELWENNNDEIDKDTKRSLLQVLAEPVLQWKGTGPLMVAAQKTAASLAQAFEDKSKNIDLPSWPKKKNQRSC